MSIGPGTGGAKPPEFDFPVSFTGPDGIGASPYDDYGEEGTDVEVGKLDGLQKRISAKVVGIPFYDPKKERPRS